MEYLPNYDNWKTTPPEEPKPDARCNICGKPMWKDDVLYTIDGGICEVCLDENYRSYV